MLIIVRPEAEKDLQEIGDFIAQDNPAAAEAFVDRLKQRCSDLAQFPNIGRKRGTYRTVTEGDYVIFYRLPNTDTLVILRIVHGKRDMRKVIEK